MIVQSREILHRLASEALGSAAESLAVVLRL